jgi:hypothetical protein
MPSDQLLRLADCRLNPYITITYQKDNDYVHRLDNGRPPLLLLSRSTMGLRRSNVVKPRSVSFY